MSFFHIYVMSASNTIFLEISFYDRVLFYTKPVHDSRRFSCRILTSNVILSLQFSSVNESCHTFVTTWTAAHLASLSITNSWVHPNPCPLSQWCHPAISSSVVPFSLYPQSFPASGSLQMIQLFTSGVQSIGVSASTSVLPKNTQDWSPLGWTGWISLQSKGLSEFSPTPQFKSINSSALRFLHLISKLSIIPPKNKTTGQYLWWI